MLRIAGILLLAGLGAPAADAAERDVGGEISLGYGFKPEFVEADGDGKYALAGAKVTVVTDKTWSLSIEESLKATEHPEKKAAFEDPVIRLSYPTEAAGLDVAYGLLLSPGLSLASRDADYYGAARPGVSVSKKLGRASLGASLSATKYFRRYTLADDGTATSSHRFTSAVLAGYELGKFSASLSIAYRETVPHEGPHQFGYLNELSLEHQTTEQLGFEVTFTTSDSQQEADGSDVDEFSVYRQNKTEVYLGATYAL